MTELLIWALAVYVVLFAYTVGFAYSASVAQDQQTRLMSGHYRYRNGSIGTSIEATKRPFPQVTAR